MADKKPQIDKFREAARELETDDSEERFDKTVKDIAQRKDKDLEKRSKTR